MSFPVRKQFEKGYFENHFTSRPLLFGLFIIQFFSS
jgi:hypothetical protein